MSVDILLRHGVVAPEKIAQAHALRQRHAGVPTIGECLIHLGAIDEDELVQFYHKRLMIPLIDDARLASVSPKVLSLVPPDMAYEFRVIPIDVDSDGTLTLAMSDPTNNHAVDEVAFFTDRFVVRGAARESAVRRALVEQYRVKLALDAIPGRPKTATQPLVIARRPMTAADAEPVEAAPVPVPVAHDEPVLLTRIKRSEETPLPTPTPLDIEIVEELPGRSEEAPILLTQKRERHSTLPGVGNKSDVPDPPLGALREAQSRDEVAKQLLDYVARLARRAMLFVVKKSLLVGHMARGEDIDPFAVKELAINMEAASIFHDVVSSRLPYRGPLPMTATNRAFALAIGGVVTEVVVMPIAVRDRIIAVLYVDGFSDALPEPQLHTCTREAGLAYERLILAAKR